MFEQDQALLSEEKEAPSVSMTLKETRSNMLASGNSVWLKLTPRSVRWVKRDCTKAVYIARIGITVVPP